MESAYNSELTFTPRLNQASLKLAEKAAHKWKQRSIKENRKSREKALVAEANAAFTFRPTMNSRSERIVNRLRGRPDQNINLSYESTDSADSVSLPSREVSFETASVHVTQEAETFIQEVLSSCKDELSDPEEDDGVGEDEVEKDEERTEAETSRNESETSVEKEVEKKPDTPTRTRKSYSLPYNNADYLYKIKFAKETALAAIKEKKTFTILGPYPYLRRSLLRRGWVEKFSEHSAHPILGTPQPLRPRVAKKKKKTNPKVPSDCSSDDESSDSELRHDPDFARIVSRLLKDIPPTFIWTIKRDDIDFKYLNRDQIVNHYCRASSFTTKIGLCQHLRSLPWYDTSNPNEFFPRCYQLYNEEDREDFIEDFEMCASVCILKLYLAQHASSTSRAASSTTTGPGSKEANAGVPLTAVTTASNHLRHIAALRNDDYLDAAVDPRTFISPFKRKCILGHAHALSAKGAQFGEFSPDAAELARTTLALFLPLNLTQNAIEGHTNTWIMKPGAKSRGRGVIPQNSLEEIMRLADSCKEEKWVIQKYIEQPLLVHGTKFDIRQWFMVTDWNPLTLYFYQDSYLRFGSRPFTLTDFDPSIHLCNNSIQKKFLSSQGRCETSFAAGNMWTSSAFKKHLDKQGCLSKWEEVIFPGMKKSIQRVMMTIQDIIEDRKNSFELYGADFMLDSEYTPWLIEINCSPAMGATTKVTERLCSEVLDDCIKVVIDKKECRSAPTGKWEVIYKQANVSVPPYIGVQLTCEGRYVPRPAAPRKKAQTEAEVTESAAKKIKSPRGGGGGTAPLAPPKPEVVVATRRPAPQKQELKSSKIGVPYAGEEVGAVPGGITGATGGASSQPCCAKPTGTLCKQVNKYKRELNNSIALNPPASISLEQLTSPPLVQQLSTTTSITSTSSTTSSPGGGKDPTSSTALPSIVERTSPHLSTLSISPISSFPPSEDRWQIRKHTPPGQHPHPSNRRRPVSEILPNNINPYKLQQIISRQAKQPKQTHMDMLALQKKYSHDVSSVKVLDMKGGKKRPKVGPVLKKGSKIKSLSKLSNCPHCETGGQPGIILNLLKDPSKAAPRRKDHPVVGGGGGTVAAGSLHKPTGMQSQRPKKQFRVSLSQISTMSQKMLDIQQSGSTLKVVGEQQTSS